MERIDAALYAVACPDKDDDCSHAEMLDPLLRSPTSQSRALAHWGVQETMVTVATVEVGVGASCGASVTRERPALC